MNIRSYILFFLFFTVLSACNNAPQPEEIEQVTKVQDNGEFYLSKAQLEYAEIEFGSIRSERLSSDVHARGELILPVNAMAHLVSLYPGIVKTVYVREGDAVKEGQILATLNSTEFIEAQQRYLMVKNQLAMLEKEYERQKELNTDKISSDKYYQKALADFNVAQAELKGLGLQLRMAGLDMKNLESGEITSEIKIIAPIKGHIEDIQANPGKYIMQDEKILQIINRTDLLVELNVFEKDIMKVRPGQRVTFTLANLGNKVYEAEVIAVGNMVREKNRVVKVLAEFQNTQDRMLPGMFVASEIHTGEEEVEALPEEAILRIGNDQFIIFFTTPEKHKEEGSYFFPLSVKTGYSEDGFIEVFLSEDIPADAMIVVKGGYYLKTELAKQADG